MAVGNSFTAVPGKLRGKATGSWTCITSLTQFSATVQPVLLDVGVGLWQKRIILKSNNERLFFSLQRGKEREREGQSLLQ